MSHPRFSIEEIGRRGEEIYQQSLRDELEAANMGRFLVIDIETGEYEMDDDEVAHTFGGSLQPTKP